MSAWMSANEVVTVNFTVDVVTLPAASVDVTTSVCWPSVSFVSVSVVPDVNGWPSKVAVVVPTPEPASVAVKVTVRFAVESPYDPPFATPVTVTAGPVASILNVTVLSASTLPAASTDRYVTVCEPSADTVNGAVYAV